LIPDITIVTAIAADPAVNCPRFIDGARRAPPEDVGGIGGFEEFLDVMSKPRCRERKRLVELYGGPLTPDEIELPTITARIGKLARRRAVGRVASAKSQSSKRETARH
jgi:hypothetical protein